MDVALTKSPPNAVLPDIARCLREIAVLQRELRRGNPDVEGLCLALADWSGELRILIEEVHMRKDNADE